MLSSILPLFLALPLRASVPVVGAPAPSTPVPSGILSGGVGAVVPLGIGGFSDNVGAGYELELAAVQAKDGPAFGSMYSFSHFFSKSVGGGSQDGQVQELLATLSTGRVRMEGWRWHGLLGAGVGHLMVNREMPAGSLTCCSGAAWLSDSNTTRATAVGFVWTVEAGTGYEWPSGSSLGVRARFHHLIFDSSQFTTKSAGSLSLSLTASKRF